MSTRINIAETDPKAYKAMMGLEAYLAGAGLDQTLKELIKIRASQINGCAFCIDMHSRDALKRGETPQRLFLLSAWREAGNAFSDNEKLALEMTEEITLIHQQGLSEETYQRAIEAWGEAITAAILMLIVTINAWNRIAVSTHLPLLS